MRRIAAILSCTLAALAVTAPPAQALQTLAYTFVVDCANPSGTSSLVGLPNGVYAVTVAGACTVNSPYTYPVGATPCTLPVVGTVPCLTPITSINNFPGQTCTTSVGGAYVSFLCGALPGGNLTGCSNLYIVVDGVCLGSQAGLHYRPPGAGGSSMNVRFADSLYSDNTGFFVVTVVWTPL